LTRAAALATIRVSAYHDDMERALRAYIESGVRISYANFQIHWDIGKKAKGKPGMCSCLECKRKEGMS
jgi:hypothetical protein